MRKGLRWLLVAVAFAGVLWATEPYRVVFETIDCNGETGLATVEIERIYKIEPGDCTMPGQPGVHIKKMLVKNDKGSFDIFTLPPKEAEEVMKQVKAFMKAKLKSLEQSQSIIVEH